MKNNKSNELRIIIFSVFLFLVSIAPVLAWDNDDCKCNVGMTEGLLKGQGNVANCNWVDKTDSIYPSRLSLIVYDSGTDYSKALEEIETGKEYIKGKVDNSKNFEEIQDDNSYVIYYQQGSRFNGWAGFIKGNGYQFTVTATDFKSLTEVKNKMDALVPCIEQMTKNRMEEQSLSDSIEKDDQTSGSKGMDYVSENSYGSFIWNIKYLVRRVLSKNTPLPWVETAIGNIGAGDCDDLEYRLQADCYHKKAIESGNYLVCEESYDIPKCYAIIANQNKDVQVCDKIREYIKWGRKKLLKECYDSLSGLQTNVQLCLKYPYKNEMDNCFLSVAKNTGDPTVCDRLKYPDKCKVCAFVKSKDESICLTLKDKEAKEACTQLRASGYCYKDLGRLFEENTAGSGSGTSSRG